MSQYIGKTISLISNKGIRYAGLLDNINAEDATVALKSVRSFGTEGRMAQAGQPNLEAPPGTDIYEYVVFRGSDVKDLSVLDVPIDEVKPEQYHQPQFQQPPQQAPAPGQFPTHGHATLASASDGTAATKIQPQAAAPAPVSSPQALQTVTQEAQPQRAQAQTAPAPKRVHPRADPQPRAEPQPSGSDKNSNPDFDFETANAKFSREGQTDAEQAPSYNKTSSFFDTISSSTDESGSRKWSDRSLNIDTFGEASVNRGNRRRGGNRGNKSGNWRGRGGRGGYQEPKPEWA